MSRFRFNGSAVFASQSGQAGHPEAGGTIGIAPPGAKGFSRSLPRGRTDAKETAHVDEQLRPPVPRHHLGREPRAGARLRGGRLPAGGAADRGRYPALDGRAQTGAEQIHHPAAGRRRGRDPVGRVRRRHHRHADLADDPQHRPAVQGLWRDRREVPARPCRHHLFPEVRPARLSRRRAVERARDGGAGGGRRRGAAGAGASCCRGW